MRSGWRVKASVKIGRVNHMVLYCKGQWASYWNPYLPVKDAELADCIYEQVRAIASGFVK